MEVVRHAVLADHVAPAGPYRWLTMLAATWATLVCRSRISLRSRLHLFKSGIILKNWKKQINWHLRAP